MAQSRNNISLCGILTITNNIVLIISKCLGEDVNVLATVNKHKRLQMYKIP